MEITSTAIAGTLESSDIQFKVKPHQSGRRINLESPVKHLYEADILAVIHKTLDRYEIEAIDIHAIDNGALDCTIEARLICALLRAAGEEAIRWGA